MMGNKAMNASWPIIIQLCNETSSCCRGNWFWRIDDERYFFCADAELIGNVSLGEKENRRMRCRNVCNCKNLLRYFHPGGDYSSLNRVYTAKFRNLFPDVFSDSQNASAMVPPFTAWWNRWHRKADTVHTQILADAVTGNRRSSQMPEGTNDSCPIIRVVESRGGVDQNLLIPKPFFRHRKASWYFMFSIWKYQRFDPVLPQRSFK